MTSTPSTILRLELMGSGDQAGTWGTTTNTNLGTLLEGAVAGASSVSVTSANQALTATNYATDQSRMAILILTTTTAANFAVYAPGNNSTTTNPITKTYAIYNNTSYTATIYNSTSTGNTTAAGAGVDLAAGEKAYVFSDGKNFYKASPATLSLSLGTAAAPSLSFIGDANTGIYSAGAEQLNITSNGVRMAAFNTGAFDVYAVGSSASISASDIYTSSNGSSFNLYKARNNGSGAAAVVNNGDYLGVIRFLGYDGANYWYGAQISASVDGAPGTNDMPGRLSFWTTPDGSTTLTERMRIDNAGNVGIGTTSPSTLLHVSGGSSRVSGTNGALNISNGNTSGGMRITALNAAGTANGYLAIEGYSSEYARFSSSGDATFNGAVNATGALSTQSTLAVGAAGATATVSGSAPMFMCRAWVNFVGNGGVGGATINGSGNIASVTKNSTGNYTITFSTAMPIAGYAITSCATAYSGNQASTVAVSSRSTSSVVVLTGIGNSAGAVDAAEVYIAIFC